MPVSPFHWSVCVCVYACVCVLGCCEFVAGRWKFVCAQKMPAEHKFCHEFSESGASIRSMIHNNTGPSAAHRLTGIWSTITSRLRIHTTCEWVFFFLFRECTHACAHALIRVAANWSRKVIIISTEMEIELFADTRNVMWVFSRQFVCECVCVPEYFSPQNQYTSTLYHHERWDRMNSWFRAIYHIWSILRFMRRKCICV